MPTTADGKFLRACGVQCVPMSHMLRANLWDCTARYSTRGSLQHELPVGLLDVSIIGVMGHSQGLPRVQASSTQQRFPGCDLRVAPSASIQFNVDA